MLKQLLISLSFIICSIADAKFQCLKPGKIRYLENKKTKALEKNFCIGHFNYDIMSYSCLKSHSCDALIAYYSSKKLKTIHGPTGSHYHKKCYVIGGHPKMIEYFDGKKWHETAICQFQDNSFISVFNSVKL